MNEVINDFQGKEGGKFAAIETRKPALIFDFGGVLLDWNPRRLFIKLFDGDVEAMEKFMAEIDFFAWNFEQDRGRSFAEGVAELSSRFPHYADLIRAYDERWEETVSGPIQSTVDTLQPLKDNGHALYALSNWSGEKYHIVDHKWPFFDKFDAILISGFLQIAKPEAQFFNLMLSQIGRPADECVFIDDSAGNIIAAQKLGFKTIHFQSTAQMLEEMAHMNIVLDQ